MFSRRVSLLSVLAVGVAAIALTACGSSSHSTKSTATATKGPIVIAASEGFTGSNSFFDVPDFGGAKLAIADINANGGIDGRKLEFITDDNESQASLIVPKAQQLVDHNPKPSLLLVSNSDTYGDAAARVASRAGILAMAASGPTDFGTTVGPLVFNFWEGDPDEAAVLAQFAHDKGWKTAYLVNDESLAYTTDMCNLFTQSFESWGGSVVGRVSYNSTTETSFPSQVSAIRSGSSKADVILICGLPTGAPTLMKETRSAGVTTPFLATGGALDGTYWVKAVPNLGTFYADSVASSVYSNDPNPVQNALRKRYGKPVTSGHIYAGYSAIQLFAEAVKLAHGNTSGPALAAALETLHDFPTMAGPTTYSKSCHTPVARTLAITKVANGQGSWVESLTPSVSHVPKPGGGLPC
jgi:branched-chain amino acid transport system substrate-binding protein